MREIKFRAWDGQKMMMGEDSGTALYMDFLAWYESLSEEVVLMQYTGLKDKNGKEIYFGDILQTSSDDPETDMWKPEDWGYTVCQELDGEIGVTFSDWHPTYEKDCVFDWQYVEIIGNIYENPELIK